MSCDIYAGSSSIPYPCEVGSLSGLIIQGSGFVVPELSVHDPQHWSVASGAPGWIEKNLGLEGQKSRISGSTGLLVLLYYYVSM